MGIYDRLVAIGWIDRIRSEFTKEEIEELHARYFDPSIWRFVKPRTHSLIVARAHNLVESVFARGGAEKDCRIALEYLLICLDCEKYHLNWKKYRVDNSISLLEKKYVYMG